MQTDVQGRVRNVSLPASKPLLPLYEAIINSIEAIEDMAKATGHIEVTVRRDQHLFSDLDQSLGDIVGFKITDNGIGFTDDNYGAFETSDTTYKASRGGKGVGRFLWLVAFKYANIESHYQHGDKMVTRSFRFSAQGDGISELSCAESEHATPLTIVTLAGFKEKYRRQCPRKLDTIAAYIIEYCLEYFIRPNCPTITLNEDATGESLNLNNIFEQEMAAKSTVVQFKVGDHDFRVLHVRLYSAHAKEHLAHFCANDRVVKSERLSGKVPNLVRHLEDTDGRKFVYAAYIDSDLLNSTVNSERTEFTIAKDKSELFAKDITWRQIRDTVVEQCGLYLSPFTETVLQNKAERIDRFVATEAPMYRPILKHISGKVEMIDPEIEDDDLDLQLYEAYHDFQVELKAEGQGLLQDDQDGEDGFDEYNAKLKEYFEKVSDVNAADLARYVCHRMAILDFLQKQLGTQDNGKYRREDRIHNIIFPMGATSDEILPDGQNLWLIDEKLAYHAFLASDKQLRTMETLNNKSQKEPDIIVFDKACAFAPATEAPFPAIVIIEFKRPMRDDYTEEKNPFVQIRKYITDIRSGKARTPDGRDVPVPEGIPFYCYVVCDIGSHLEQLAYDFELMKTPDGQGFFGFKKQYNAYFEVISYSKMVTDAKKRNAVLFNKLGLPSRIG